jgi:PAS domain S-box-containing protein
VTFSPTWTSLVPFFAAALAAAVAALGHRNKGIPGGLTFTLMMCSVCEWMFFNGLADAAVGGGDKHLFFILGGIGLVTVAPFLVQFSHWYRHRERGLHWWQTVLLWLIPVGIIALTFTNEVLRIHGRTLSLVGGVLWRQILFGYSIAYTLSACMIIAQPRGSPQTLYIRQTVVLITGFLLPILGGVLEQVPGVAGSAIDPIGLGFSCMGLVLLIGLRSFQLMNIVPVARNALIEKMVDGLIVFDPSGRVVDINPAAAALLGTGSSVIGFPAKAVLGAWYEKIHRLRRSGNGHVEAAHLSDPWKWCDLQLATLRDSRGAAYCWLLVVRDLTDRKNVEREREKLIDDLGDALADVQTLSGLLPICASCKKIRDDTGYWQQLEAYITTHSEAQFSHGICPECARKLYPGFVDDEPGTSS